MPLRNSFVGIGTTKWCTISSSTDTSEGGVRLSDSDMSERCRGGILEPSCRSETHRSKKPSNLMEMI